VSVHELTATLYDELQGVADRSEEGVVNAHNLMDGFLSGLGGGGSPVDPLANTAEFVTQYGLTIDRVPFDLTGNYRHLLPVYEDEHPTQVLQAGAQTGKSARVMAGQARNLAARYGSLQAYYFPDKHLPVAFSRDRFKPFLRSNPLLGQHLGGSRGQGAGKAKGTDNTLTITWGETVMYFLTTAGRSSTEGLPMQAVYFDEVRRMVHGDVERAMERYSAQADPIDWKVSTANYPDTDINYWFNRTDQRHFHTACSCPSGIVLSLSFPDCILDLRRATPKIKRKVEHAFSHAGIPYLGMTERQIIEFPHAAYFCPKCGDVIVDPREGWWEPHAEAYAHGYQMPQLLTWTYPAGRALGKWENNDDLQELFNSMLGRAFVDPEKMPVKAEHVLACVDMELEWGERLTHEERRRRLPNCTMGVDIQRGYSIAVIKHMLPSGKHATVHLEVVINPEPDNPRSNHWVRLGKLMHRYDVSLAVIDAAPEFTAAEAFALAFPGRVYLQDYSLGQNAPGNTEWIEKTLSKDDKRKGELKVPWRVRMKRTHILHWAGHRWIHRRNAMPDPDRLVQSLPTEAGKVTLTANLRRGSWIPVRIARDPYLKHLTSMVYKDLVVESKQANADEKVRQGKTNWVAEYVGDDPHFAHADAWASAALTRVGNRARPRMG
jgi:hypothetical protein